MSSHTLGKAVFSFTPLRSNIDRVYAFTWLGLTHSKRPIIITKGLEKTDKRFGLFYFPKMPLSISISRNAPSLLFEIPINSLCTYILSSSPSPLFCSSFLPWICYDPANSVYGYGEASFLPRRPASTVYVPRMGLGIHSKALLQQTSHQSPA
mgnify:CR=1 FL=1